jgi:hypothetical protein
MKKIKITTITKPNKYSFRTDMRKYSVSVGGEVTRYFSNHPAAVAYITAVNNELNYFLVQINELIIECFSQYRRCWFYFDLRLSMEREILDAFKSIDKSLQMAIERGHWENGNAFAPLNLKNAALLLIDICENLQKLHSERFNAAEKQILQSIIDRIKYLIEKIENLGK